MTFKTIKLKKTPAGRAQKFPSEIKTVQAAIAFVKSLEPKMRAKLHWKLAASALAALDTGPIREGMPRGAAVAASVASGAAALVALVAARGNPFPVMAAPAAA